MKMTWKTLLAAGCALSMLFTMPGSAVLAEELQEDAVIVSEAAQIDSEEADLDTDISADIDENAPDSGTYDAIESPADAVEEVPEMNEPFPSAETDEAVTYEDEIAVDEIAIEENASLESEEIVGAGDDYPANLKNAAIDAIVDPWNFYNRECTSFAAWCLNSRNGVKFTNQYLGASRWGNANTWGMVAKSLGVTVNMTPAVGAIAWWTTGKYGHVAWVSAVNGSSVFIEEYNYKVRGGYGTRTIAASNPAGYIHIKDITPSGKTMTSGYDAVLPDGDYQILCAANTDYYLDIDGSGSEPNGANVKLYNPASDSLPSCHIWTITYSNGF
jgi:surface antigen